MSRILTLSLVLVVCGGAGLAAAEMEWGFDVEKSTASLRIAWNYQGECALTNENDFAVLVDYVGIYDSNGVVKASTSYLLLEPEQTKKIVVLGANDRYHCDARGFHPANHESQNCTYEHDRGVAENVRLLFDVVSNGSSISEAEGEFVEYVQYD